VRICKAVFEFAVTSIKFHSDHYIKQRGVSGDRNTTIAIKNDFVAGYLQGLKDKFKEQIERENLSVILIKDSLVVREYESYNMKKGGKISARSSGDSEAKEKGYKEGRKFRH
jgi:hypothetical protein